MTDAGFRIRKARSAGSSAPSGGTRRIHLCADDYGISPAVDAAIRDLIVRRRINATSVMVVAPSFSGPEAVALRELAGGGAAVGLHLTLTAPFRPLTAGFGPRRDGAFLPLPELMLASLIRRLDRAVLAAEIAAQLAAFSDAFGRPPDFVDGHQHVQLLPQVREEVLSAMTRGATNAWLRQCGSVRPLPDRLGDRKGLVLDWLSRALRRRARAHSVAVNPAFAGTYDFRSDADFATLFPRFLEEIPDGGVIMCHPGMVDAELARLDPLTGLREKEYRYLAGEAFVAVLAAHGVALA